MGDYRDIQVGDPVDQPFLDSFPKGVLAKHLRTTAVSGVTATELGVQRIDGISVRNGYTYMFSCPKVNVTVSALNVIGIARLRVSTSGSATTGSPLLAFYRQIQSGSTSNTDTGVLLGYFEATADGTISVIQTVQQVGGTGTSGLYGSATEPNALYVTELGISVADTGVDI